MSKQQPTYLKPLVLSYCIVGAFTILSIVAPILLDRKRTAR
ncbi:MAG TPA: hypothetical protein VFA10_00360 [Ktedonobacteraceae bacterium]|jgi:hypothetical protein|nr:hypothetical protein [Ktedonobacteraceae bacterium]